jgi:hypothetical protein
MDEQEGRRAPAVDLYWIPLGAGGYVVRWSGKLYEALKALAEHRRQLDLYHTALQIWLPDDRFVIECAAILNLRGEERGVVAGGPVGMSWLGRFRHFRYEIRRWRGGSIPDLSRAVLGPVRVATDLVRAQRLLDLAPSAPTPVWGRDELHTGEMWNSNSVVSWLLTRAGIEAGQVQPPAGGRAPGWNAGLVVARRQTQYGTARRTAAPRGGT